MSKVVLITGCRSGFGLLSAVSCARAGHVVYAGLRDVDTGDALREASQGLDVRPLQLDVTVGAEREAAVRRILDEQGRLDVLVNNAGIALGGFMEQVDEDELRRVFEVNVFGVWALTKAALPALRDSRGAVVQISSMAGRMAFPGLGVYAASKFALEGMSEALRLELQPFGVQVTLIEPGAYRTDIFGRNRSISRHMKDPASPYAPYAEAMDRNFESIVDRIARDPQEVADAVLRQVEGRGPRGLRVPMGPGAGLRAAALKLAPRGVVEALLRRVLWREVR